MEDMKPARMGRIEGAKRRKRPEAEVKDEVLNEAVRQPGLIDCQIRFHGFSIQK